MSGVALTAFVALLAQGFACPVCGGTDLHYCETEPVAHVAGPSGYRRARRLRGYFRRPSRKENARRQKLMDELTAEARLAAPPSTREGG